MKLTEVSRLKGARRSISLNVKQEQGLTRRGRDRGEQDPGEGLDDRERGKAAQHNFVFPAQCIYPEGDASGELFWKLVHVSHLSIRNICAESVDHMKKIGCRIAV